MEVDFEKASLHAMLFLHTKVSSREASSMYQKSGTSARSG
jgi:hypothetical protein